MPKDKQRYTYVDDWKTMWEPDLEAIAYNGATCDPTRVDPKVLQWAKQNCSGKPHFIKIINKNAAKGRPGLKSHTSNGQLTVPIPFVREHFRQLERVVTLENGDGRTWRVSFGSRGKHDPSWQQGWNRVTRDNNLKPGDVIVFVLVGNSHFHMTLFDEDGNTSEKITSTWNDAAVRKETSSEEPSDSDPESQHPKTKPKRALVSKNTKSTQKTEREAHVDSLVAPASLDRHDNVVPQLPSPTSKKIPEPSRKKRRLHEVTEEAGLNYDYDPNFEGGSTSMGDYPSSPSANKCCKSTD